jgi:hypothetical protein
LSDILSVDSQPNKAVFATAKLNIDEYAESLGLPSAPRIRFLQTKAGGNLPPIAPDGDTSEGTK